MAVTTLTFPHCHLHIVSMSISLKHPSSAEMCRAGILDMETPAPVGYQVTIQVPEDYHPTRVYHRNFTASGSCSKTSGGKSELYQPHLWDRYSGYLWFDAPLFPDLKEAIKMVMIELALVGWWELAEEIHQANLEGAARECDA